MFYLISKKKLYSNNHEKGKSLKGECKRSIFPRDEKRKPLLYLDSMAFSNAIRLQTLFWEIKNRFFYILVSFVLSFAIAYQKSNALLYLFVLSYTIKNQPPLFSYLIPEKIKLSNENEIFTPLNNEDKDTIPPQAQIFGIPLRFFKSEENCSFLYNNDFLSTLKESLLIDFSKILNSIDVSSIRFIFTDVEEAFKSQLLISLIFSFASILPLLSYNLLSFFVPSFYFYESKRLIYRLFFFIIALCCFSINVQNKIIPELARFLLAFQINSSSFNVVAETKIYSYCNWVLTIFLITHSIFILIYLILFLITNEKIKIDYFIRGRRLCRVLLLLFSGLIAPPDLFIQLFLTLFFIFCFELFIFVFFVSKNFKKHCSFLLRCS